jgi:hypothetical protein
MDQTGHYCVYHPVPLGCIGCVSIQRHGIGVRNRFAAAVLAAGVIS